MSLTDWMWVSTAAYGIHAFEEFEFNWRDWARAVVGLPVEWHDFYVVNFLVIVLGVVAANLAATQPALALGFPALMAINALFFHVVPMIRTHGRWSPGVFTAVVLFFPISAACYGRALADGTVGAGGIVGSFVLGALLMASPIVFLKNKAKPYFRQDR